MDFTEIIQGGDLECGDNPSPMIYKFDPVVSGDEREIYAIWSPTSCNIEEYDFTLENIGDFTEATLIELEVPSTTGIRTELTVANNSVDVMVSERPIFVVINEAPEEVTCPSDLDAFNITCSSVSIAWDIPDGQTYDHYQLWYGPLGGIDDAENPDIFNDDITLFDNDVPGDVRQAVIGGLIPETEYLFYVIGIGENNSTGWCDPIIVTTTEEGCNIPLDESMITGVILDENGEVVIDIATGLPRVPPDLDHLIDDQNDPNNNIDCCSLPESNDYSTWSTFNRDVVVTIDLGEPYDIDFIYLFDGNGLSHVFFDYLNGDDVDNDDWVPLADYVTIRNNEWYTIVNEAPPCQPIRFLRIRSAMNDGQIDELVLCGKPVTLDNLPNADFTFNQDCGTVMFTSAEGTDGPNFTHLWSFGDNANSTSTDVNPTFEYPVSGTYTVTHTVTNECGTDVATNMVEVDLTDCGEDCDCTTDIVIGTNENSVTLIDNSNIPAVDLENGFLNLSCVEVNGRFIVDREFDFNLVTFKMGPDAEIIIDGNYQVGNPSGNPDITTFRECNLLACQERMWQGIRLVHHGALNFVNNEISDAVFAIEPTDQSSLNVEGNDFNRNYIGIEISEDNPNITTFVKTLGLSDDYVYRNIFRCDDDLLEIVEGSSISFSAARLHNAMDFNIGTSANDESQRNLIIESVHGVVINNSAGCDIQNNEIRNLAQPDNDLSIANTAILLNKSLNTFIRDNEVVNVPQGIASTGGSSFQVYRNIIEVFGANGALFGVGIQSNSDFSLDIAFNTIRARKAITIVDPITGDQDGFAIRENGEILGGVSAIEINGGNDNIRIQRNNNIQFRNIGIRLGNTENALVFENNLIATHPSQGFGILLSNAPNNQLIDNNVNYDQWSETDFPDIFASIISFGSANNFYCCNEVDNSDNGITFFGANTDTDLNTTVFHRHSNTGLQLWEGPIGEQEDKGNDWRLAVGVTGSYAQFIGNFFFAPFSEMRQDPLLYPGPINQNILVPVGQDPLAWFPGDGSDDSACLIDVDDQSAEACGVDFSPEAQEVNTPPSEVTPTDLSFSIVNEASDLKLKGINFEAKRQLFTKLDKNPSLISQNSNLADFYFQNESDIIGTLNKIDAAMTDSKNISYFYNDVYLSKISELELLNSQISTLRKNLVYASSEMKAAIRSDISSKIIEKKNLLKDLNVFLDQYSEERSDLISEATNLNTELPVTELFEKNQKQFNQLYLALLSQGNYEVSSNQKEVLYQLAFQCYFSGGRAVIQARSLLDLIGVYHDYQEYDENCDHEADKKTANSIEAESRFSIFPNPSASRFTVDFGQNLKTQGTLRIINTLGEEIFRSDLAEGSKKIAIDLKGRKPGIYYLEIKGLGDEYIIRKLLLTPTY